MLTLGVSMAPRGKFSSLVGPIWISLAPASPLRTHLAHESNVVMRQAGTLPSRQDGERFAGYLLTLGISSKVESGGGEATLWVHDENQLPRSKEELALYLANPTDPRYQAAQQQAKVVLREAAARAKAAQKNYVDMRQAWSYSARRRPITLALIAASVVVWLAMNSDGFLGELPNQLAFWMPAIREGEVWRLITPIFIHFGWLHILFNMWWLYDLGTMIEARLKSVRFAFLVLAIAAASNYCQGIQSGPNFGGMSGVVFGLFGYAWVRGRLDPTSGLYLRPDVVFWMMAWFFLCLAGAVAHVANTAHGVGLVVGAALGYLPQLRKFFRQNT